MQPNPSVIERGARLLERDDLDAETVIARSGDACRGIRRELSRAVQLIGVPNGDHWITVFVETLADSAQPLPGIESGGLQRIVAVAPHEPN